MKPVMHALFLAAMFGTAAAASSFGPHCSTCEGMNCSLLLPIEPPAGEGGHNKDAKPTDKDAKAAPASDAYLFDVCAVTGEKLGEMGKPVVKVYDGREVKFCCGSCPAKFEKDKAAGFAKIDAMIAKDQLAIYPIETSVVSGKALGDKAKATQEIYHNRLVLLADAGEKATFEKDAAKYIAELDKAVIEKQGKDYPLTKCAVSGEAFGGDMGEPQNLVVAGRLVKVCCGGCKADVKKDPAKYVKMVDDARAASAKKADDKTAPAAK